MGISMESAFGSCDPITKQHHPGFRYPLGPLYVKKEISNTKYSSLINLHEDILNISTMLSRAFNERKPSKKSLGGRGGEESTNTTTKSQYYHYDHDHYEDCIVGLTGDLPINFCDQSFGASYNICLRDVMMGSVQVMGESGLGISEKVVLLDGVVYASKRFRRVTVSKRDFGKGVERLAHVSKGCNYLLQVSAYLYAKRIKLVLSDYHPMGSLRDLLDGARELGHTPLDWHQRLLIVLHIAKAISYIHGQSPTHVKHLQLNIHGNIKASNVLIRTDLSACLAEYGFSQLAETPVEFLGAWQNRKPPETTIFFEKSSQKSDIYNFGILVLDMLGGPQTPNLLHSILARKEEIKEGVVEFFEFTVEGKERKQALQVLDIALACTNRAPEARPSIDQILLVLGDVLCT